jgi:methyl-accepting chemotaxis protein
VERLVDFILVVTCIMLVTQVFVLSGILLAFRKLTADLDRMRINLETKIEPAVEDFRSVLGETKKLLVGVQTITENFAEVSETVKVQVQRVNDVIEDTTDRARLQIAKVDEIVSDAVDKMQATTEVIQQSVLTPVRELSALIAGISGGLQFLFSKRKNHVDQVHQDEELFI